MGKHTSSRLAKGHPTVGSDGDPALKQAVATVRAFNRMYTRIIGVLNVRHLRSAFGLGEVRVLYEIAHHASPTAAALSRELHLDAGYVSRMLRAFERRALIERIPSARDGRQHHLRLTAAGGRAFDELDARASADVETVLTTVREAQRRQLVVAMRTIGEILTPLGGTDSTRVPAPYLLRTHRPGDMGWVVQRHGALYAQEYDWNEQFEALVAEIVAHFLRAFDAKREACWIAERDGENVGCVFLVKHPERPGVAKLRLLVVEPTARGLGIGRRLVDECVRFATHAGYHTITLWTNSVLLAARRIYEAAGFALMSEDPHHSFGHDLVAQTWELKL
jgi:DNA-binding MarR family transcriptional regulator/GNAT superfamily N-acetyltransferase